MAADDVRVNARNTSERPLIELANTEIGLNYASDGTTTLVLRPLDRVQGARLYSLLTDAINRGCVHIHFGARLAHGVVVHGG